MAAWSLSKTLAVATLSLVIWRARLAAWLKVPRLHVRAVWCDVQVRIIVCADDRVWQLLGTLLCLGILFISAVMAHVIINFLCALGWAIRALFHLALDELLNFFSWAKNIYHGLVEASGLGISEEDVCALRETLYMNPLLRWESHLSVSLTALGLIQTI